METLAGDASGLVGGVGKAVVIKGATSQTYEVQAADVPGTLQCVVKGTNAATTIARASGLRPTSPGPVEAAPVATAQAAPRATYAGASVDGRYVFFALGDGTSPGRLFRFDTQDESAAEIAAAGIFALASPDGSHAFFSSEEAIGEEVNENGEEPEEGAHNLYAWDGTKTRFVGRFAAADFEDQAFTGYPPHEPGRLDQRYRSRRSIWAGVCPHPLDPRRRRLRLPVPRPPDAPSITKEVARYTATTPLP